MFMHSDEFIYKAILYIKSTPNLHYANKPALAEYFNMSVSTLSRRLTRSSYCFQDLINHERLCRCYLYLSQKSYVGMSIDNFSYLLGFSDVNYFYGWLHNKTDYRINEIRDFIKRYPNIIILIIYCLYGEHREIALFVIKISDVK